MKRLIEIGMICIITLVLSASACSSEAPETVNAKNENAKSDFPSHRLYKVVSCDEDKQGRPQCGSFLIGSEFAIVQETKGPVWRLWLKRSTSQPIELCAGNIEKGVFKCAGMCDDLNSYLNIFELDPKDCDKDDGDHDGYSYCVRFEQEGNVCPTGGSGTGGHD